MGGKMRGKEKERMERNKKNERDKRKECRE